MYADRRSLRMVWRNSGYGQNRGVRLCICDGLNRVDYVGCSSGLCKLLYVVVAKD
ncbi:hypothetical protein DPMN_031829 [Dreissena polymorpha]|uniref:Uncharacterized protein n=1 Tax=Dreissena polymorpha TaxID=45954 RepID=A0A9D4RID6_DREPO|nr:hypothetical protein DPMN_031829 [Dreissena polymorpha]